jgi:hypothetical protein
MVWERASRQLDLFRGLAALLMVVNHAAVAWLDRDPGVGVSAQWAEFLGSLAPMLFFTATGIGCGMRRGARAVSPATAIRKPAVLLVADALMWAQAGRFVGLDFLGFIGIAMLSLDLLHGRARSERLAWVVVAVVVAARFVLAPALVRVLPAELADVAAAALGQRGMPGFSYSIFPWLAYPMLGYLLGRRFERAEASGDGRLLVLGGLGIAATMALHAAGAGLFRWGSLSLAFFVFGIGAGALAWGVCGILVDRLPRSVVDAASLRGIASLALVPIHYAIVAAALALGWGNLRSSDAFLPAAGIAVVLAFLISKAAATALATAGAALPRRGVVIAAWSLALASLAAVLIVGSPVRTVAIVVGQLALCLLLVPRR